ncbi:dapper homolog 2-like [Protopterus annectens]|uniref:dapper homolog 2-like n=1 Tax=Protopterus annectens TaxID=7888 RepID=UPI001CFAD5E9|nr:dapper homolog 2-like [Protopterus annectens]
MYTAEMLPTRKVVGSSSGYSGTAMVSTTVIMDRARIGERIQATLAGLHELKALQKKHEQMVFEALSLHVEPVSPQTLLNKTEDSSMRQGHLAATLAVLKEQLSRLRRQDYGLKGHLQQLDQQLSDLQLGVSSESAEHLESDSRPSSGFYELSDGGSCSLSNSCSSVYSDCLSSSHNSLLPSSHQTRSRISMFDYRPRSADETTVHLTSSQPGVHIRAGCRIRTSPEFPLNQSSPKQRPVSTGDLEKMMPPGLGFLKTFDPKTMSPLCGVHINLRSVDSKYQNDLVSKNGGDAFRYPSPLHAVALQSPLFTLVGDSSNVENKNLSQENLTNTVVCNPGLAGPQLEIKPRCYIDKLVLLNKCKLRKQPSFGRKDARNSRPALSCQVDIPTACAAMLNINGAEESSKHDDLSKNKDITVLHVPLSEKTKNGQQELSCCSAGVTSAEVSEDSRQLHTAPLCTPDMITDIDARNDSQNASGQCFQPHLSENKQNTALAKPLFLKKVIRKTSVNETLKRTHKVLPASEFVHAKFVCSESHQMKVKHASTKTKATKIKRRSSERQRCIKQTSSVKPRDCCGNGRIPNERGHKCPPKHNFVRQPNADEISSRTCSESTLCSAQYKKPHVRPLHDFSKTSTCGLHAFEATNIDLVRKKHRKWLSAVEISAKVHHTNITGDNGMGLVHSKQQVRKAGVLRTVSFRAQHGIFHHSIPSYAESDSEYSAECASLFHSTIVETSEDEISNCTTNRFGDSESSESESGATSDSSLSFNSEENDGSEIVWPEGGSLGPSSSITSSSMQVHSKSKMYRIKASKALKKRIRRFQPSSLKVMTMV